MPRDTYGDWCVPPESPKLIHSKDLARKTNGELIGTAYFFRILQLMRQYAATADKSDDAARYDDIAERMRAAFDKRFFHAEMTNYDNGTQTSSLLPLLFGLVPQERRARVFEELVAKVKDQSKSHIGTGLVGVQHLLRTLSDNGRPDLALQIATQKDYPSLGYMADHGATTVWELWNGDTADPAMNSGNHVMLMGDLLPWLYEYPAGIRPDPAAPGYRHIVLKPVPVAGLDFVRAWRQTISGRIESRWQRESGQFLWDIAIPIGATATVYVPAAHSAKVTENGKPITKAVGQRHLGQESGAVICELGSGKYTFRVNP